MTTCNVKRIRSISAIIFLVIVFFSLTLQAELTEDLILKLTVCILPLHINRLNNYCITVMQLSQTSYLEYSWSSLTSYKR